MNSQERTNAGLNNLMSGLAGYPDNILNVAEWADALPTLKQLFPGRIEISKILAAGALLVSGCGAAPQPPQASIQIQPSQGRDSAQYFGVPTSQPLPPDVAKPPLLPTASSDGKPVGASEKSDPRSGALPTPGVNRTEKLPTVEELAAPPMMPIPNRPPTKLSTLGQVGAELKRDPNAPLAKDIPKCNEQLLGLIKKSLGKASTEFNMPNGSCFEYGGSLYYFVAKYDARVDTLTIGYVSQADEATQRWEFRNIPNKGTEVSMHLYLFGDRSTDKRNPVMSPQHDFLGVVQAVKSGAQKFADIRTIRIQLETSDLTEYGPNSNMSRVMAAYNNGIQTGLQSQVALTNALKAEYTFQRLAPLLAAQNARTKDVGIEGIFLRVLGSNGKETIISAPAYDGKMPIRSIYYRLLVGKDN